MERVTDKASQIGAETYGGFSKYDQTSKFSIVGRFVAEIIGKIDNGVWLLDKMIRDYHIVDIGLDPAKISGSSSYALEQILTYAYKNIEHISGCK